MKDGVLTSNGTKFHAFLFNDVFILTKKDKKEKQRRKYIYVEEMPMTNVKLFDYVDPIKCTTGVASGATDGWMDGWMGMDGDGCMERLRRRRAT